MNSILEETKFIMNKYNIKANKSLGQNFLINEEVINKIVESSEISNEDLVIEIGPGLGTLTKFLLEKAKKVICIELDPKMITILNDRFKLYDNLEIKNEDVLKVDLKNLIRKEKMVTDVKNVKIVANLPYYITTPIIMKLLEEELDLESITVMIQKEVADRLIAVPGDENTGAITYAVYYYSVGEKIIEVQNNSFIPEPEVTSEVIKITIRDKEPIDVKNKELMFKIIKSSFMQRRKTLLNSLNNANIFNNKDEGIRILKEIGLPENIRAEKLTLQDFANIANKIS
ncbi:MAG: 16S rRNA (adenine(1518)-N(6)/adenine(1519)-N(6))-dimethyltransferase RsmA [Clostridia bacterium]|nr:16S rRNA (adenine(1518)-N(6)/adenine(1519)-N(6))-dimethyltransferase RsmA [Clostridia bacterium]